LTESSKGAKLDVILSASGVFGSALLWLLSFKVIAFWLGPTGVGLYSQLRQIIQAATICGTFGGTNLVVQGLSERSDLNHRLRFRATTSLLISFTGVIVSTLILIFAKELSLFLISSHNPNFINTIRWLSVSVLLSIGSVYLFAVLNGYRAFQYLALAQIMGPFALVTVLYVAYDSNFNFYPESLAIAFSICFGMSFISALLGLWRIRDQYSKLFQAFLSPAEVLNVIKFAISSLVAALSSTIVLLLIRSWIIKSQGLAFAGLFDAVWILTFNYTTLFLTACSTIYLPLLAAVSQPKNQKKYILKMAYIVLVCITGVSYLMVLFKTPLIHLLYSSQFDKAGTLLTIMVIAIILRGVSWVYGMLIIARKSSRVLVVSELVLNLGLLVTTKFCLDRYSSLDSLGWAFVIPNFIYLVFVVEYVHYKNTLICRRYIWPLVITSIIPLIFLATGSEKFLIEQHNFTVVLIATGMIVFGVTLYFYRKLSYE
jgi:O-antigen/teichoic acid export membrane protein